MKMRNKFLAVAMCALLTTSACTISYADGTLSPSIINVVKKLSTVEAGEKFKSLNSAKEFYDYLKELDSTFTKNDFVEFINQLLKTQNPADVAFFVDNTKQRSL